MPPYFAAENWYNTSYAFGDKLGEGGFGTVRRATHLLTGDTVAVKIMNKAKLGKDLQHIYQEIKTMKDLMHQNICRLYQVVETKRDIYLILEYCEQGEMFDYIVSKHKLPEPEARHFFRQLVMAIAYTHRQGYAHRDLKPENLLLKGEDRALKVIDFGLSSETKKQLETYCGSLCYAAPEIIMNRPYKGPAADIWSMGVLLYILVTGSAPFNSEDQRKISYNITHGIYKMPEKLSPDCQSLIRGLLTVDPEKRMKMDEIMRDKWVMDNYNHIKASSIYSKDKFEQDIVNEMAINLCQTPSKLVDELRQWKFDYNTATYLILLSKKENKQSIILPNYGSKKGVYNSPTVHASLEKDLDDYCSIGSKQDAAQLFDRQNIAFTRSPMNIPRIAQPDKENVRPMASRSADPNVVFATPKKVPEGPAVIRAVPFNKRAGSLGRSGQPGQYYNRANQGAMPQTPINRVRQTGSQQSPITLPKNTLDQKTTSQRSTTSETPPTSDRQSRSADRSSRRPRIVASLERGSQRVFELLTPRRLRRDNSQPKVCKNFVSVSVTRFGSAEELRDKLVQVLENLGFTVTNNGWKVYGNNAQKKMNIELEVVAIEKLSAFGVKRKRMSGDGFLYKSICESILQMSGINTNA